MSIYLDHNATTAAAVRFSFGHDNTEPKVELVLRALSSIMVCRCVVGGLLGKARSLAVDKRRRA